MNTRETRPPILGIDLGTSTCEACVILDGRPVFVKPDLAYAASKGVPLVYDDEVMPSLLCARGGEILVGFRAEEVINDTRVPAYFCFAVKKEMGRSLDFPIPLGDRTFTPAQITGHYVKTLVQAAEIQLGLPPKTIREAVVTVPANFGLTELMATEKACTGGVGSSTGGFGGLREVRFVDEPVAAAYSLGLHKQDGTLRILVADFGGGTLDLALMDVGARYKPHGFRELARDGISLGGIDWDRELADWSLRKLNCFTYEVFQRLIHTTGDYGHSKLFWSCEQAKINASFQMSRARMADPRVPLDPKRINPLEVKFKASPEADEARHEVDVPPEVFLKKNQQLLLQCDLVCNRLFAYARERAGLDAFGWGDLDRVYLAGGGSLLTPVQRWFAERRGGESPLLSERPQHAVALGAAMLADRWRDGAIEPATVARKRYPRTIGFLTYPNGNEGEPVFCKIVPRGQSLPILATRRKIRVRGDSRLRRLEIDFAERDYDPDDLAAVAGLRDETRLGLSAPKKITTLMMKDLPPPPPAGEREEVTVTVEGAENQALSFQIEFRGKVETVLLNSPSQEDGWRLKALGAGSADPPGRNGHA